MLGLAAIFCVSSSLGYLLPAIIGLESMGIPSPGETALVLAAVLASQGKLEIWLVILIGVCSAIIGDNIGYLCGRTVRPRGAEAPGPFHRAAHDADRGRRPVLRQATARRRCSSRAGSRSCGSPPRGLRESTTCRSRSSSSGTRSAASPGRTAFGLVGLLRWPGRGARDRRFGVYAAIVLGVVIVVGLVALRARERRELRRAMDRAPAAPSADAAPRQEPGR